MSKVIQWCIQKFPNWPPGVRTANGTALCHLLCESCSEFCRHNPLCCFWIFRYRLSPETSGFTLECPNITPLFLLISWAVFLPSCIFRPQAPSFQSLRTLVLISPCRDVCFTERVASAVFTAALLYLLPSARCFTPVVSNHFISPIFQVP